MNVDHSVVHCTKTKVQRKARNKKKNKSANKLIGGRSSEQNIYVN